MKNEAILQDILQKRKVDCKADGLVPMRFAIFPDHLSKLPAPATKEWCQVIRSAAPVTQNHLSQPEDRRLQNATPLRKSAPGPPNSSDEHVSCTAPATENASFQILFKCHTPAIVFWNATKPSRFAHFWQGPCTIPCACNAKRHLNVQKWCEHVVLFTFWNRNVLRATTACEISTSELPKVARMWGVLAFSLANVLRTTKACTFSTL